MEPGTPYARRPLGCTKRKNRCKTQKQSCLCRPRFSLMRREDMRSQGAIVQELNPQGTPGGVAGDHPLSYQFHVYRLPSLYPGVQW